jgi:hypothetical protein
MLTDICDLQLTNVALLAGSRWYGHRYERENEGAV